MGIWTLWYPDYALDGVIKALTAIVSIGTLIATIKLMPQALMLSSPARLEALNKELQEANRKLETMYEQARESGQLRVHSMVDNALDAVIAMDQDGRITEWNKQAEITFGWSYDEAVKQGLAELIIPEQYRPRHRAFCTSLSPRL
ncbi:MAG: PAS domain-containing protein [Rickettsiales bacterium]|nr:PAS domain-containing protein [Rickettsiales bacterium]